jgi:chorismate synthase
MENGNNWRLYGHPSAATQALSLALNAPISLNLESEIAAAIFAINASSGVDQVTVMNFSCHEYW